MKVSAVSLGTWLTHDKGAAQDVAIECTRRAFERGVNFFDTANEYQEGRAEEILGMALRPFSRDSYLVGTKAYHPMGEGPLERGLSRKHLTAQVDQSLRRLGMDHIDLFQCHSFDSETPLEETAQTMDDLIRRGKVLYWGVSNWSVSQVDDLCSMCDTHGWSKPVSNQLIYSALWREIENDIVPKCEAHGLGILAFSPLAMGVLSGKYIPGKSRPKAARGNRSIGPLDWLLEHFMNDDVLEAVQKFTNLAKEAGHTPPQLALCWCLRANCVSSVITGATRASQLEDSLLAGELNVDEELIDKVDELLKPVAMTARKLY